MLQVRLAQRRTINTRAVAQALLDRLAIRDYVRCRGANSLELVPDFVGVAGSIFSEEYFASCSNFKIEPKEWDMT